MATLKKAEDDLEGISAIKNIVQSYQEIANLRMNSIREKVLKNRKFFIELSKTYQKVKTAYFFSLGRPWMKKKETSFLRPKKEKIIVFLSANKFFYGSLILNIWQEVRLFFKKNNPDLAVVGKVGKYLSEQGDFGKKTLYFDLDDDNPEPKQIKKIVEVIKEYKEIIIFYGKYETVLRQAVIKSDIAGGLPPEEKPKEAEGYLFEPSAKTILQFFEREIIATLFNQTLLEHQLARYAGRMIAMHLATENAKEMEKKLKLLEKKLLKQKINKKQIELFNSII